MLKLHTLGMENIAGVDSAYLSFDDHGVTVIYGQNEGGKSTILKAFELLLGQTRVKSSAREIKAIIPKHRDEQPYVEAEMTVGKYRLFVSKTFHKSQGKAVLEVKEPVVENHTGREAEDRLQEILAEGMDSTLREALTIRQGEGLDTFAAASVESLASTLGEAESAGESLRQSSSASKLLARVDTEFKRYFTKHGRVKKEGELDSARLARDEALDRCAEAQLNYQQAQSHVEAIDGINRSLAADRALLPEAQRDLETRSEERAKAEAVESKLQQLVAEVASAQTAKDSATAKVTDRQQLAEQVTTGEEKLAEITERLAESSKAVEEEAASLKEQQKLIEKKEGQREDAKQGLRVLGVVQRAIDTGRTYVGAASVCRDVEKLVEQQEQLRSKRAENPVTTEKLGEFREAVTELRRARSVRDAVATSVIVEGPEGEQVEDSAGDPRVIEADGAEFTVTSRRELRMGEFKVTVTPAEDLSRSERAVDNAQRAVEELSEALGVEPGELVAVEKRAAERAELVAEEQRLDLSIAGKTGGRGAETARAQLDTAAGECTDALREARQQLGDSEDRLAPGMREKLEAMLGSKSQDAEEWADNIEEQWEDDLAAWQEDYTTHIAEAEEYLQQKAPRNEGLSAVREKHFRLEAEAEQLRISQEAAQQRLDTARAEMTDARLKEAESSAEVQLEKAQAALDTARESFDQHDVERVKEQFQAAQAKVEQLKQRIQGYEVEKARHDGQLQQRAGAKADLEDAVEESERLSAEFERVEAQALAVQRLWETLQQAQAELRARYEKPFKTAFESMAAAVFGSDVEFTFDEKLGVSHRALGGVSIEANQLSGGAQEQMFMLARLAVATLVGGGESVPIFIDDGLGFSDTLRMSTMNLVLGKLGREHQVIVLTCDANRFDSIPGARQLSIDSVKAEKG